MQTHVLPHLALNGLLQSLSEFFSSSNGGGSGCGGLRGGLEAQVESMKTRAVVQDMAAYMRRVNPRMAAAMIGAVRWCGSGGGVRAGPAPLPACPLPACPPACLPARLHARPPFLNNFASSSFTPCR